MPIRARVDICSLLTLLGHFGRAPPILNYQGVQSPVVLLTENRNKSIILSLQDFLDELCSAALVVITVGGTTTGLPPPGEE